MRNKEIDISKRIFVLSFLVFMLSLFGQLYVSSKLAVKSKEMLVLDNKRVVLQKEISELALEKSQNSSLAYIEIKAKELGFAKNDAKILTIKPVSVTARVPSL